MHRRSLALAAACLLVVVAGCTHGGASPAATSTGEQVTVDGRVTAGPTCPVVRAPPASACADRPVPGAGLVVLDGHGVQVERVSAGPNGVFELRLAPGSYRLVPQPVAGLLGTAPPVGLVVGGAATPVPIVIVYDTGIR